MMHRLNPTTRGSGNIPISRRSVPHVPFASALRPELERVTKIDLKPARGSKRGVLRDTTSPKQGETSGLSQLRGSL